MIGQYDYSATASFVNKNESATPHEWIKITRGDFDQVLFDDKGVN